MIKKAESVNSSGTSYHGDNVTATLVELCRAFGEPTYIGNVDDKSQYDWVLMTEWPSGESFVFTIYDWKEYRTIRPDATIQWHIGAHSAEASAIASAAIQKALFPSQWVDEGPEYDSAGFTEADRTDASKTIEWTDALKIKATNE